MDEQLHGEDPYVPEQEREKAERSVPGAGTSEEAEEAERALADVDEEPEVLPPTDEEPVEEVDPDTAYADTGEAAE